MISSKSTKVCEFCKQNLGIYSCPRCSSKYCSANCYRSREHELCSESFFQEWVESSTRAQTFNDQEKGNMLNILKKCYDESLEDNSLSELSVDERFAGLNIDEIGEDDLWHKLNKEEKAEFRALIKDDLKLCKIVSLMKPWWVITSLNLVSDLEKDETELNNTSTRPPFPLNVKKLSALSSKKPSDCLKFNLINILYSYSFLYSFYNCDLKDSLDDFTANVFMISPVLSSNRNYHSLEESIQDTIRLILNLNLKVSLDFIKSITDDVRKILQGPENAKPCTFVLCALHDVKIHLLEAKQNLPDLSKFLRKQIVPAVKKIEYFLSWSLEYESNLSVIASDLILLMVPDFIECNNTNDPETEINVKKPFIEEIS